MRKEEVLAVQANRQEAQRVKMGSEVAVRRVHSIYRVLSELGVSSIVCKALKDDIDSGEVYNKFHLYNSPKIEDVLVVYNFYK